MSDLTEALSQKQVFSRLVLECYHYLKQNCHYTYMFATVVIFVFVIPHVAMFSGLKE